MLAESRPDEASAVVEAHRRARKRVLIIGGGFAGIAAAHALRHADADVLLIDRRNHHIFQPLLYQVATAVLSPAEIAAPIRQLEAKQRNVTVLLAEVTAVDVASHTIEATSPGVGVRKISFDYLVVATGMRPSYFGHDEFARYAPGLKSLGDAETIRAKILGAFELAATTEDANERATDDICAGRRRSQWRGTRGILGASGERHAARQLPPHRSLEEHHYSARRKQACSADFCRGGVAQGDEAP
jgi:NADH dehydrogenase